MGPAVSLTKCDTTFDFAIQPIIQMYGGLIVDTKICNFTVTAEGVCQRQPICKNVLIVVKVRSSSPSGLLRASIKWFKGVRKYIQWTFCFDEARLMTKWLSVPCEYVCSSFVFDPTMAIDCYFSDQVWPLAQFYLVNIKLSKFQKLLK